MWMKVCTQMGAGHCLMTSMQQTNKKYQNVCHLETVTQND